MLDAIFTTPDLATFARLDGLGLEVTGQLLELDRAVFACRVVQPDEWCRWCGCQGIARDTVTRELAHEPLGWCPTALLVAIRWYRCRECSHVWRQDTTAAAGSRARISRAGLRWGLAGIVVQHLSMARVAEGLGVSWNTTNDAVLAGRATAAHQRSGPPRRGQGHRGHRPHPGPRRHRSLPAAGHAGGALEEGVHRLGR